MKKETGVSPAGDKRSKIRDRVGRIAATSAATIVALQSTAFARSDGTAHPQITEDGIFYPLAGPVAVTALGAALATIGAYRLRKPRKRDGRPEDEKNGP